MKLYPPSAVVSVSMYTSGEECHGQDLCGSTLLVYGTQVSTDPTMVDVGEAKDDETELNYFGARYLDPMLGLWTSVDPMRQFYHSYLYANNNPIIRIDPDGNQDGLAAMIRGQFFREQQINIVAAAKGVPSEIEPFVKNSVMNATNTVGSALKETVFFVEPAVTATEFGIPVACAFMGNPMSVGLLASFIGYNALVSGLKYGVEGSFASLVVDGIFAWADNKFAPGGKAYRSLV